MITNSFFFLTSCNLNKKVPTMYLLNAVSPMYHWVPRPKILLSCLQILALLVLVQKRQVCFNVPDQPINVVSPPTKQSTYKVRRAECDELAAKAGAAFGFSKLADVKDEALLHKILDKFQKDMPKHCKRLLYIYHAQKRFYEMMEVCVCGCG